LHITQIQGKLHHKERQLQSVFDDQRDKKQKITLFPKSWEALMEGARSTLSYVALPLEVDSRLKKCPFSESLAREIYELLEVLHGIGEETELDGRLSQEGLKIHQSHFVGDNAWFSDESATNKRDFRSELTFLNHRDGEAKLCPWHGKITQHQIRIHFEWPRAERERHITVVYIGPKLTKH